MNYLNQKISAKLEKLGLKSESKAYWIDILQNDESTNKRFIVVSLDFLSHITKESFKVGKAYTLQDILSPDNLKKLFGEEKDSILYGDKIVAEWEWEGRMILDHYWQGWEQLEEYLRKCTSSEEVTSSGKK